jgi:hypothetical protein
MRKITLQEVKELKVENNDLKLLIFFKYTINVETKHAT